ncbi:MAG: hypothetical protein ACLP3C_23490 [Mycobacterium sp.]|uniref:hypothetical protein n=1 Tax=Mycobacterium sp. TaxID=1785 RepID=UPI003F9768DA
MDDMKRLVTVAVVAAAAAVGCAPAASAVIGEQLCEAMNWPMPLPPMVGYGVDHIMNDSILICFDNIVATAPDGHDVLTETGPNESGNWRVTSMSPAAGTLVMRSQPITMTVVRDYNAPS